MTSSMRVERSSGRPFQAKSRQRTPSAKAEPHTTTLRPLRPILRTLILSFFLSNCHKTLFEMFFKLIIIALLVITSLLGQATLLAQSVRLTSGPPREV